MAQIVRAILLAKAIATSILGFRAAMCASHDPSGIDFRPSQFRRDIAPIISSLRISDCPALEMRPSRSLPPDENCRGTRPSQAAKSRPHRKFPIGGAKASTASAVNGPTPGMVCKRRAASAAAAIALIFTVRHLCGPSSLQFVAADHRIPRASNQASRCSARSGGNPPVFNGARQ